jgi:hypothetical protein
MQTLHAGPGWTQAGERENGRKTSKIPQEMEDERVAN